MNVRLFRTYLIAIAILSLSSCATKVVEKPVKVEVPVKCEVPEVKEPEYLPPTREDNYPELLRKLLHNYAECRAYSERLKKAMEVCR